MDIDRVRGLVETIAAEQDGRIHILVNDLWGDQPLAGGSAILETRSAQ